MWSGSGKKGKRDGQGDRILRQKKTVSDHFRRLCATFFDASLRTGRPTPRLTASDSSEDDQHCLEAQQKSAAPFSLSDLKIGHCIKGDNGYEKWTKVDFERQTSPTGSSQSQPSQTGKFLKALKLRSNNSSTRNSQTSSPGISPVNEIKKGEDKTLDSRGGQVSVDMLQEEVQKLRQRLEEEEEEMQRLRYEVCSLRSGTSSGHRSLLPDSSILSRTDSVLSNGTQSCLDFSLSSDGTLKFEGQLRTRVTFSHPQQDNKSRQDFMESFLLDSAVAAAVVPPGEQVPEDVGIVALKLSDMVGAIKKTLFREEEMEENVKNQRDIPDERFSKGSEDLQNVGVATAELRDACLSSTGIHRQEIAENVQKYRFEDLKFMESEMKITHSGFLSCRSSEREEVFKFNCRGGFSEAMENAKAALSAPKNDKKHNVSGLPSLLESDELESSLGEAPLELISRISPPEHDETQSSLGEAPLEVIRSISLLETDEAESSLREAPLDVISRLSLLKTDEMESSLGEAPLEVISSMSNAADCDSNAHLTVMPCAPDSLETSLGDKHRLVKLSFRELVEKLRLKSMNNFEGRRKALTWSSSNATEEDLKFLPSRLKTESDSSLGPPKVLLRSSVSFSQVADHEFHLASKPWSRSLSADFEKYPLRERCARLAETHVDDKISKALIFPGESITPALPLIRRETLKVKLAPLKHSSGLSRESIGNNRVDNWKESSNWYHGVANAPQIRLSVSKVGSSWISSSRSPKGYVCSGLQEELSRSNSGSTLADFSHSYNSTRGALSAAEVELEEEVRQCLEHSRRLLRDEPKTNLNVNRREGMNWNITNEQQHLRASLSREASYSVLATVRQRRSIDEKNRYSAGWIRQEHVLEHEMSLYESKCTDNSCSYIVGKDNSTITQRRLRDSVDSRDKNCTKVEVESLRPKLSRNRPSRFFLKTNEISG